MIRGSRMGAHSCAHSDFVNSFFSYLLFFACPFAYPMHKHATIEQRAAASIDHKELDLPVVGSQQRSEQARTFANDPLRPKRDRANLLARLARDRLNPFGIKRVIPAHEAQRVSNWIRASISVSSLSLGVTTGLVPNEFCCIFNLSLSCNHGDDRCPAGCWRTPHAATRCRRARVRC